MPGIAGLVTRLPRARAECELRRMLGVLRHESFYASRTWINEGLGLYVGWTTREGSFSDGGPLENENGDVVMIFSGEEYSGHDVRARLMKHGHHIEKEHAAHLVHLYEDDPSFPSSLNGLFHGVVADSRNQCVKLFTDRFGMHRLYVHESDDATYFAAEAKAILAVRPELRSLDLRSLGEWITLGCVQENRTLFAGLTAVPGASVWTLAKDGVVRKSRYFHPGDWKTQEPLSPGDFYEQARHFFVNGLSRYFEGPEPTGMSLTGGIDTRIVMAWQRCAAGSLPCYTWVGPYRECRDVTVAREVARACGQPHHVIAVGSQFLQKFDHYAARAVFLTDGCADVSLAPDVYMNEQARAIASARMTGLYGSQVFRRMGPSKPQSTWPGLFDALNHQLTEARSTYARTQAQDSLSFELFTQVPWRYYGSFALEQTQVTMRTPFLDNELVKLVYRAPDVSRLTNDVSMRLIRDGSAPLSQIPTDHGLNGSGTLSERLSYAVHRFSFKAEYAFDYGMPQWLARMNSALRPLQIERAFLGRHKPHHFRVWYRDELSNYVRETLLDPRSLTRPYLDASVVHKIVSGHIQGQNNFTVEIHKLLSLELLHRSFLDQPVGSA